MRFPQRTPGRRGHEALWRAGYKATSVAQIEGGRSYSRIRRALSPLQVKEALLEAGIDRQLDRRRAMRDIRALFGGLGDLRNELTMMGRYLLTVLDEESQLLQIASSVPAGHLARLDTAYAALFDGLYAEAHRLGAWLGPGHGQGASGIDWGAGRQRTLGQACDQYGFSGADRHHRRRGLHRGMDGCTGYQDRIAALVSAGGHDTGDRAR